MTDLSSIEVRKTATYRHVNCAECGVRQGMICAGLSATDIHDLGLEIDEYHYQPKSTLFEIDEPGEYVYSVKKGLVKLVRYSGSGEERILRLVSKGSVIGIELLVGGQKYNESAVAVSDAYVCKLPVALIQSLENSFIGVVDQLTEQWQQHLLMSERTLLELSTGPVRKRIIRLIRLLIELQDNQMDELRMLTTEEVAAIIGSSVESASHVIAELKREKTMVRVAPHTFKVDQQSFSKL